MLQGGFQARNALNEIDLAHIFSQDYVSEIAFFLVFCSSFLTLSNVPPLPSFLIANRSSILDAYLPASLHPPVCYAHTRVLAWIRDAVSVLRRLTRRLRQPCSVPHALQVAL